MLTPLGGSLPPVPRPSDLGVEGMDGLWGEGEINAHGVPDYEVTKLVAELERLEGTAV